MAIDMQYFILTPILLSLIWKKPKIGYSVWLALFCAGTACQVTFTILDDEYFHGGFSYYIKPWNRSQPYLIGILLGIFLHKVKSKKLKCFSMLSLYSFQRRDNPKLRLNPVATTWFWSLAAVAASAAAYGPYQYNLTKDITVTIPGSDTNPPLLDRVMFNGIAKIAWSLAISWVILACVKGKGGIVNSILSWPVWIPLSRVQYCLYLLHR